MPLDPRCRHTLDNADGPRCQLLAGHGRKHLAVVGTHNAAREAWRWSSGVDDVRRNPFQTDYAAGAPWAPGMPAPEKAVV